MKDKIVFLIIGILIGAIITTTGFLIYNKIVSKNSDQTEMMQTSPNGQMGEPPSGDMQESPERPNGDNREEPPARPDGDNGEEPPARPDDSNNITNN